MGIDVKQAAMEATNPYTSAIADRLIERAAHAKLKLDSGGWELISEVLSFAASAEVRMAEQEQRILQLEHLSESDELTGIRNRRGFTKDLAIRLSSAARYQETGVVGFLDMDNFKQINDSHGHAAGDAMLRHMARMLTKAIRPTDIVARLSGDEFGIVLTQCSEKEGRARVRMIQRLVNDSQLLIEGRWIGTRCSAGCAPYGPGSDMQSILEAADQSMYRDKERRKSLHILSD